MQRGLTAALRKAGEGAGDLQRMQAWAGQGAGLACATPAGKIVTSLWSDARALLHGA